MISLGARVMRILLADDEQKVRSALRLLLEQEPDLHVVSEAVDAEELQTQMEMSCPDLVLLDWELPGLKADAILLALRAHCAGLHVIVLSGQPEARPTSLSAGADGFVSKSDPPERLLAAIYGCHSQQEMDKEIDK